MAELEWREWHETERRPYGCSYCPARAEALLDGVLVCLDCGDLLLERLTAIGIAGRRFVNELPAIADRVPGL